MWITQLTHWGKKVIELEYTDTIARQRFYRQSDTTP